ncbi:hypothetical protein [Marinobacter sp. P4B1]|uniref:hypothetical protein n=1 Tax=Marinobacter sp. P4B1 TaxID=1119533 RepID=UPI00071D455F|nr:hypothetical protein [Marinobacter sp. P4B1]KRW83693.1 hypothetical protein AQ621_16725 [Marinobacter sp. P4B1]
MNSRQVHHLATNPKAMMEFRATGRLPRMVVPSSPLISLLESLSPRDRQAIRGIQLHPSLGYLGGIRFHTAEQLYRWLKPAPQMLEHESWPAESYRDKRFHQKLSLDDLRPFVAGWPDHLS